MGSPSICSIISAVRVFSPTLSSRSSSDRASRIDPAPALATSSRASSSALIFSRFAMSFRWAAISRVGMLRKSYRWQRDRIVVGIFSGSVVARMNFTCDGGSSSVFKSALNECLDSMWTSSMM